MDTSAPNITSIFMTPTLGHSINKLKLKGYLGAYSGVKDIREDPDAIFLLFNPDNIDFSDFLKKEYETSPYIIEDFNYENNYVVVVYGLNPLFKEDFDKVRLGKYSKTSKDFQELFPKIIDISNGDELIKSESIQYKIFNKTKDLRDYWEDKLGIKCFPDQELWDGYDAENELLKL